jgi:hypothetical protein
MVIASDKDGIYQNLKNNFHADLDNEFKIGRIKQIIYDIENQVFYILANKYKRKIGMYLI